MERNSLTQLVKEIEDAYWDASIEVGQAREAECDDIAESALMADDDASHAMSRLDDRIEDLKRMVNAPDFADAKDFEPKCPWPRLFEAVQLTAEVLTYLTEQCGYLILRQCKDNSSDYDYWVDVFYSIRKPDSGKSEQQPEEAHLYMYQTKDFTLVKKWCENGDEQYISVKEMAVHRCDETDFGLILRRIICMPSYETDVPEELKKRVTDVLAGIPDDYVYR